MKVKVSLGKRIFDTINIIILVFIGFACITPILHIFFMSISEPGKVSSFSGLMLWPQGQVSLKGYELIFQNSGLITGYLNTIFYVVVGTCVSILLTLLGGYVLSRKRFKSRNVLMFLMTFTMLFSGGLIPFYMVVKNIGLLYTRWALIIPTALNVISIVIMRTAFLAIPDSIEESVKLDGAKDLTILFRILAPLSSATIAVLVLFYAVEKWNDWFYASIFLNKPDLYPLQIILRDILLQNQTTSITSSQFGTSLDTYRTLIKYTTIVVATVPILCVYPFVQKQFVTGVMIGSIKG
jgi:putative aldouronate transport system permease protein